MRLSLRRLPKGLLILVGLFILTFWATRERPFYNPSKVSELKHPAYGQKRTESNTATERKTTSKKTLVLPSDSPRFQGLAIDGFAKRALAKRNADREYAKGREMTRIFSYLVPLRDLERMGKSQRIGEEITQLEDSLKAFGPSLTNWTVDLLRNSESRLQGYTILPLVLDMVDAVGKEAILREKLMNPGLEALGADAQPDWDQDPFVKTRHLATLTRADQETAFKELTLAVQDPSPMVRQQAVITLRQIGGEGAIALLEEAAQTEFDPIVQMVTQSSLEILRKDARGEEVRTMGP